MSCFVIKFNYEGNRWVPVMAMKCFVTNDRFVVYKSKAEAELAADDAARLNSIERHRFKVVSLDYKTSS